jgi:hypothetical protein
VANFQVHLESLSGKRKKERKRKPMKPWLWLMARLKGLHHHQQHYQHQMASMRQQHHLQQHQLRPAQPCWLHHL